MYADNNFYGHRTILAKYCNISDKRCFASIQHGMLTRPQEENLGKRKFSVAPFLCWNERVLNSCIKKKIKNVHAIGAPFLYLEKIQNEFFAKKTKEIGTLVFPTKSTWSLKRYVNYNQIIKETENLFEGPFTVCIYFEDLNNSLEIFKKKNWNIATCGLRDDKSFLFKLWDLFHTHKNIIHTSINTSFFYSLYLKKKTKLLTNSCKSDERVNLSIDINQNKLLGYLRINHPYLFLDNFINEKYLFAAYELGLEHLKSREELKNLLGWNTSYKVFFANILNYYFRYRFAKKH
jgi:hypothetical protein